MQSGLPKTVTLVLGGARSGKSRYAQGLASAFERVVYIATARRDDAEMRAKIAHHRRERPSAWKTVEVPSHVIPVAYLCVGYVSEFAARPELESAGWLARLPLEELIFYENWGKKTLE